MVSMFSTLNLYISILCVIFRANPGYVYNETNKSNVDFTNNTGTCMNVRFICDMLQLRCLAFLIFLNAHLTFMCTLNGRLLWAKRVYLQWRNVGLLAPRMTTSRRALTSHVRVNWICFHAVLSCLIVSHKQHFIIRTNVTIGIFSFLLYFFSGVSVPLQPLVV